jgi:hypothetical protein
VQYVFCDVPYFATPLVGQPEFDNGLNAANLAVSIYFRVAIDSRFESVLTVSAYATRE